MKKILIVSTIYFIIISVHNESLINTFCWIENINVSILPTLAAVLQYVKNKLNARNIF